ncbi:MAG TPA: NAD-dependent epimerase/dehydratase family protein [Polyangiaceae bacterium]|nr:NAD-dependent epimerase/dehydratase family protein [Polyangiaceae bacterium]
MKQRWTLVTGASGFIGSRLVAALLDGGENVKAFVRPSSNLDHLRGFPSHRFTLAFGEITVEHTIYRALAGCDRMYHTAANYRFGERRVDRVLNPTVDGTVAALSAARRRGIEKIVVTGSTAALGVSQQPEPMDEEHAFDLADPEPYSLAKYEADRRVQEFAAEGLPVVTVLPSAVVGPGDWKPTPTGEAIVRYLRMTSLRMPVAEGGLNLVDIDDVVAGHLLAMDKGKVGERYILGGEDVTYEQLFEMLSELTGLLPPRKVSKSTIELGARLMELGARLRGGRPALTHRMARDYVGAYLWVTSAKAKRELGYTHGPVRDALARAVRWYLQRGYVPEQAVRRVRLELRPT